MNCWEVLGIEPDSDKKTIKIAYAKLLKKHRPEEDPEGFQRLHKAYKNALQWVPEAHYEDETPWMTEEGKPTYVEEAVVPPSELTLTASQYQQADLDEVASPAAKTLSAEDLALIKEINHQQENLGKDWEFLYDQVNTMIKSQRQVNEVSAWRFLETLPSMRDLEFRKAAADKIFEAVAEVNAASLEQKNLYIQRPVINYLNQQFGWDKKWQQYEYDYSRDMLDAVFPYLAEAERPVKGGKQKRELYYYRRGAAFAIDLAILFAVAIFVDSITENWGNSESNAPVGGWVLCYVLLLVPLQESSRYQGTIGKRVMGLQVISSRGDRINFVHALGRSVVTVICCLAFKVVVWINIVLSWWRSEILQDTLTRSYVTLKPGR